MWQSFIHLVRCCTTAGANIAVASCVKLLEDAVSPRLTVLAEREKERNSGLWSRPVCSTLCHFVFIDATPFPEATADRQQEEPGMVLL